MPVGSPLVNLQVKTSQETFRQFEDAYITSECTTKGQFLEAIIESYLNPPKGKTVEVSKQKDQDTIQNLTNEIGRLKIVIDAKDQFYVDQAEVLLQAKRECLNLQDELDKQPAAPILTKDQVIITIPPIVAKVLEIEAVTAKRKTGKDFTIGEILTNSFWESVTVGRVYPWKAWDRSDLSKLATELKAAE